MTDPLQEACDLIGRLTFQVLAARDREPVESVRADQAHLIDEARAFRQRVKVACSTPRHRRGSPGRDPSSEGGVPDWRLRS